MERKKKSLTHFVFYCAEIKLTGREDYETEAYVERKLTSYDTEAKEIEVNETEAYETMANETEDFETEA